MDVVQDTKDFAAKFGHSETFVAYHDLPGRVEMMQEEVDEFKRVVDSYCYRVDQDVENPAIDEPYVMEMVDMIDALVDLVYFAVGTANLLGLDFAKHWDIVQAANMKKVKGVKKERSQVREGQDAVKPAGWVPPEQSHRELLESTFPIA